MQENNHPTALPNLPSVSSDPVRTQEITPPPPKRGGDVLDSVKQKHIWDSEHVTFKIEKRLGSRLASSRKLRPRVAWS